MAKTGKEDKREVFLKVSGVATRYRERERRRAESQKEPCKTHKETRITYWK